MESGYRPRHLPKRSPLRTTIFCLTLVLAVPSLQANDAATPANFRIYGAKSAQERAALEVRCQQIREDLHTRWNGDAEPIAWVPRCEIVLHAKQSDYLNAVGLGGRGTVGATYIQFDTQRPSRILRRRVDLLTAGQTDPLSALPHEMTHVLLADRYQGKQPPPWLDEGVATLADSPVKQMRHLLDLRGAMTRGRSMTVAHLLSHDGSIPANLRASFYGQSVALAIVLTKVDSPSRIFEFAAELERSSPERALRKVYDLDTQELDRRIRDLTFVDDVAQKH
jgi:hypothetical protein